MDGLTQDKYYQSFLPDMTRASRWSKLLPFVHEPHKRTRSQNRGHTPYFRTSGHTLLLSDDRNSRSRKYCTQETSKFADSVVYFVIHRNKIYLILMPEMSQVKQKTRIV